MPSAGEAAKREVCPNSKSLEVFNYTSWYNNRKAVIIFKNGRGKMFVLLTAPWPIIPFTRCVHGIITTKPLLYFQCPKCSPQLAKPAAATALDGRLYHYACASWYNNIAVKRILLAEGYSAVSFPPKFSQIARAAESPIP